MHPSHIHSQILRQILAFQKDIYAKEAGRTPVVLDNYINEFSKSENTVRLLFDHVNFKVLHVSDNVQHVLGYPVKDFMESTMLFPPKLFTSEHCNFLYVWLQWAFSCHYKHGNCDKSRQIMCGIKVKHREGHIMRLLFRQFCLEKTAEGLPIISAISLNDISHLMNVDFYWGRIESGDENNTIHYLISTDKKDVPYDIFTEREKDILRYLAQNIESKEIAKQLFISHHTVDNHRRNMLNKIGARDTTALVQICKMTGII